LNPSIIDAIQTAETILWKTIARPTSDGVEAAYKHIAEALRIIAAESAKPRCEAPTCENAIEDSGIGRPRRYCSDACRKRAFRASKEQRRQQ
jgi:hypothetical protein